MGLLGKGKRNAEDVVSNLWFRAKDLNAQAMDITGKVLPIEGIKKQFNNLTSRERAEIRKVFKTFDADDSGTIDAAELIQLSASLGLQMTDEMAKQAIQQLDQDKTGDINFDEFCAWWLSDSNVIGKKALLQNAIIGENDYLRRLVANTKAELESVMKGSMKKGSGSGGGCLCGGGADDADDNAEISGDVKKEIDAIIQRLPAVEVAQPKK